MSNLIKPEIIENESGNFAVGMDTEETVGTVSQVKAVKQNINPLWKSGVYNPLDDDDLKAFSKIAGMDHLTVLPGFLHLNTTSHKSALGAFAELLDYGATFVNVKNMKDNSKMLFIEDNGGGMTIFFVADWEDINIPDDFDYKFDDIYKPGELEDTVKIFDSMVSTTAIPLEHGKSRGLEDADKIVDSMIITRSTPSEHGKQGDDLEDTNKISDSMVSTTATSSEHGKMGDLEDADKIVDSMAVSTTVTPSEHGKPGDLEDKDKIIDSMVVSTTATPLEHGKPGDLEDKDKIVDSMVVSTTATLSEHGKPGDLEDKDKIVDGMVSTTAPPLEHGKPGDLEDTDKIVDGMVSTTATPLEHGKRKCPDDLKMYRRRRRGPKC